MAATVQIRQYTGAGATGEKSLCYIVADGSILLGGEPEDGKDFQEPVKLFEWED